MPLFPRKEINLATSPLDDRMVVITDGMVISGKGVLKAVKKINGIDRPALFLARGGTILSDYMLLDQGFPGAHLVMSRRFLRMHNVIIPHEMTDREVFRTVYIEQETAQDHTAACRKLDLTKAGRKARDMLFEHLTPDQQKTAMRDRYFDVTVIPDRGSIREPVRDHKPITFRIQRGFPNGNIHILNRVTGKSQVTLCLHPIKPLPTDDICLMQKLLLENDPDEFVIRANVTIGARRLNLPGGMWVTPKEPGRLVIPGE